MTPATGELWFRGFEPLEDEGPRRAVLVKRLSYGERDDLYLTQLSPAEPEGSQQTVVLASRHQGHSIEAPGEWPIHVYVCAPPAGVNHLAVIPAGSLTIDAWGLLYPTYEMALRRELTPQRAS